LLLIAVSLVLAALLAVATGNLSIPDRLNPWAPLDIDEPPNFLTEYKLARLAGDGARCRSLLAGADLRHAPIADRDNGGGCFFKDAVQFSGTGISYGGNLILTCRMAVAMAMFERHVLQPAAQAHFQQPVVGLQHFGSYACRNVYGRKTGRLSQHAWANAIDIAAFRLRDGRIVSVAQDWQGTGAGAQFLRQTRQGACRFFKVVLSPDYNAAHRDHFHFDLARYSVCR
jgi:hypothetical protein